MTSQKPSLSLKKITEITHLAPVKQGFVDSDLAMTYAMRLKVFLRALFALRQQDVSGFKSPVDRLGLIHFARWQLIDKDTRLLFTTNFDGSWENYIHAFVDTFPRLLDLIWSHCKGYPREAANSYRAFSDWVELYQVPTDTLYASHADVTVHDISWMKKLKERYDRFSMELQRLGEHPSAEELQDHIRRFQKDVYEIDVTRRSACVEPMPHAGRRALEKIRSFFQGEDEAMFDAAVLELDPEGKHDFGHRPQVSVPGASRELAPENIQAGILEDYEDAIWGKLCVLQIDRDGWTSFLRTARDTVTTAAEQKKGKPYAVNVALTFAGLKRLGLDEDELGTFPIEFQLGMEARAEVLRDVGMNHPRRWPHEVETSAVDAVVFGYASARGQDECAKTLGELVHHARVIHEEVLQWPNGDKIEPFGFCDGLSQPALREKGATGSDYENVSAFGEFLLGHPNDRGEVEFRPESPELRNDSTYLVIRKLEQDVEGFNALIEKNSDANGKNGPTPDEVKAALMGRQPSGDAFDGSIPKAEYDSREHASGCPFHSHVRTANPREQKRTTAGHTPVPRILRRGMPYGDKGSDGLMFMALNASIASQYEVVQQWINGANVTPGMSTDPDPIVGARDLDADAMPPAFSFVHDGQVRYLEVASPEKPLVRLLWGLYCFVPSKAALEHLIQNPAKTPSESSYISAIRAVGKPGLETLQRNLVKRLLEEVGTAPVTAPKLWAEVRKEKDPVETAYGTLVAKREDVVKILSDGETFSVADGYHTRMVKTTGAFYLGMDDQEQHDRESEAANHYVYNILDQPALSGTDRIASGVLSQLVEKKKAEELAEKKRREEKGLAYSEPTPGISIPFQDYGAAVLLHISQRAFGVPLPANLSPKIRTALALVRPVSAYIFYPNPEEFGEDLARDNGRKIAAEVLAAVQASAPKEDGNLIEHLLAVEAKSAGGGDDDAVDRITGKVCGIFSGFFVPTLASFMSVMREWHNGGELERVRTWYDNTRPEELDDAIWSALRTMPMPSLMHRMAVADAELPSGGRIHKGSRVVVSLVPEAGSDPEHDVVFGAGMHVCPGADMAKAVLRAMVAALVVDTRAHRGGNARELSYS